MPKKASIATIFKDCACSRAIRPIVYSDCSSRSVAPAPLLACQQQLTLVLCCLPSLHSHLNSIEEKMTQVWVVYLEGEESTHTLFSGKNA